MAWTQDQLDALEAAIAQGALEVWYGDKRVKYNTVADMLMLRRTIRAALGLQPKANGRKYISFDKGV